ncbi:hypothetical protein NX059_012079 [Plenodomus lindquistii]|nr:hypothetical protein NX059_012079 [Plenodomus lindquistii]
MTDASAASDQPCGGCSETLETGLSELTLAPKSCPTACKNATSDAPKIECTKSLETDSPKPNLGGQDSRLLNLPGEILNHIYGYCNENDPSATAGTSGKGHGLRVSLESFQYTSLFHVCRQLRAQYRPMWMAQTTVKMYCGISNRYWNIFFPADPTEPLATIQNRRANVILVPTAADAYNGEYFQEKLDKILKRVALSPKVCIGFQKHKGYWSRHNSHLEQLNSLIRLVASDTTFAAMTHAMVECWIKIDGAFYLDFMFEEDEVDDWKDVIVGWWKQGPRPGALTRHHLRFYTRDDAGTFEGSPIYGLQWSCRRENRRLISVWRET